MDGFGNSNHILIDKVVEQKRLLNLFLILLYNIRQNIIGLRNIKPF